MVSERLKNIIYKRLNKELGHVEIIPYKDSIFFIDRENKYWYFEFDKSGTLWWRYSFFENFFLIFSLENEEYKTILGDWVEEVLNCKVSTTPMAMITFTPQVEEVLNCKVSTTTVGFGNGIRLVEEVLNCKVSTTILKVANAQSKVEKVLNCKVSATQRLERLHPRLMEEVLEEVLNEKK